MPNLNQQMRLADGRMLGYDEHGPSNGAPVFYFHGTPSSRVEFSLFASEEMLQSLNIRLIAPDRPGMGLSGYQSNRRITDWTKDVIALAGHLKINRFACGAWVFRRRGLCCNVCAFYSRAHHQSRCRQWHRALHPTRSHRYHSRG
ncbi:MAG: alpha/beta hydrolase [Chloroflexi bacterium]|nr:alpha/beta hydrolase [Chloroflexota bacterium]